MESHSTIALSMALKGMEHTFNTIESLKVNEEEIKNQREFELRLVCGKAEVFVD